MSRMIQAIYADGVFTPLGRVDLPDQTTVEFEPRVCGETSPDCDAPMSEGLAKIYAILGERYDSGYTDTAERHNEHQP